MSEYARKDHEHNGLLCLALVGFSLAIGLFFVSNDSFNRLAALEERYCMQHPADIEFCEDVSK